MCDTRETAICSLFIFQKRFLDAHYENMSVQYAAIAIFDKNDNFYMKSCDIFHIFAQNIDCGYTLEPPH